MDIFYSLVPPNEHPSRNCTDFIDKWPLYEEEFQKYCWVATQFESLRRNAALHKEHPGYKNHISKKNELYYEKERLQTSSNRLEDELQSLASLLVVEIKENPAKFRRIIYKGEEYWMYTTKDKIPIRFRKTDPTV